ncbi:hypothetical protein Taro_025083 [Colocasia esculenta]|uniref:Plastid division protein PDV1 n=1 Tax=Colocasia esculenta TaxID=4460 RepID=A0A843VD74_COLES|nr:hypothetical protein [Colocasia esculenta]
MKWGMEVDEVEVALEKIWDLHDSISDAIHAISRAHFLRSIRGGAKGGGDAKRGAVGAAGAGGDDGAKSGFVFVKGFKLEGEEEVAAIAETRSLNAIRTALEDFEEQLEFFHTVQSQQRAERDAAIARLEQSRIILAMRLADHHGKRYKVIEEAMAFVGDVCDPAHFITPEDLFNGQSCVKSNVHPEKRSNILIDMLISSFTFAKKFLKLDRFGGALGNATLFALSMFALLQLHQATGKSDFVLEALPAREQIFYRERSEDSNSRLENTSNGNQVKHLDVLAARG